MVQTLRKALASLSFATLALTFAALQPDIAHAATERWDIDLTTNTVPPDYKTAIASGHLVYDTATSAPSLVNISISYDGSDYSFNGNRSGDLLYFSPAVPTQIGEPVFVINTQTLHTGSGDNRNLSLYHGLCSGIMNNKCAVISGSQLIAYLPGTRMVVTAPTPVPTMTEWAMILMGLALAGAAAFTLSHRRRRA